MTGFGSDGPRLERSNRCYGGSVGVYAHGSSEIGGGMRFSIYLPPAADRGPVPALLYLAGLTCNEDTFMTKAGAIPHAAAAGLALVAPDTSPRDRRHPGDDTDWDFGLGAGFYVDATQAPWRDGYRMYSYVTQELPALIAANFPVDGQRLGVFGHSMGVTARSWPRSGTRKLSVPCRRSRPFVPRCAARGARRHSRTTSGRIAMPGGPTMRPSSSGLARGRPRS
jgi:hypothetical protein